MHTLHKKTNLVIDNIHKKQLNTYFVSLYYLTQRTYWNTEECVSSENSTRTKMTWSKTYEGMASIKENKLNVLIYYLQKLQESCLFLWGTDAATDSWE